MYVVVVVDKLLTSSSESKLSAGYVSIHTSEQVITDSAPVVIVADFNTTFEVASSSTDKSKISPSAGYVIVDHNHNTVLVVVESNILEFDGEHLRPASSPWTQLCTSTPLLLQSQSLGSVPVHATLSKKMAPVPCPKKALPKTTKPVVIHEIITVV